jgi:hypothetical protein
MVSMTINQNQLPGHGDFQRDQNRFCLDPSPSILGFRQLMKRFDFGELTYPERALWMVFLSQKLSALLLVTESDPYFLSFFTKIYFVGPAGPLELE